MLQKVNIDEYSKFLIENEHKCSTIYYETFYELTTYLRDKAGITVAMCALSKLNNYFICYIDKDIKFNKPFRADEQSYKGIKITLVNCISEGPITQWLGSKESEEALIRLYKK